MSRQLRIQAKVKWCNNTEREVETYIQYSTYLDDKLDHICAVHKPTISYKSGHRTNF